MLFSSNIYAQESWDFKTDKQLHYGAGLVIGATVYTSAYSMGESPKKSFYIAMGATAFAGIAKEFMDEISYGGWSDADLGYTLLGGLTSAGSGYLVTKFIENRKRNRRIKLRRKLMI
ncbi:hypothetical protein HHU12_10870 [Flammeovirga aprica JL-4]|uniref:Lipoprotein n=2 Tax=Flammeovirga aprica TaxID=29528 RepID=A0A7X9RTI2_9BACT|nr:hypothetical protein [Flammeovirga aprica JL-4]